ncbi:hypothetical protein HZS_6446 [Henneguya salminicola]|nr:hypothetical protein HZS_6446 [Henneguya salminicola]
MTVSCHVLISRQTVNIQDSNIKLNTLQAVKYLFIFLTNKILESNILELKEEYFTLLLSYVKFIRILSKYENASCSILYDTLKTAIGECASQFKDIIFSPSNDIDYLIIKLIAFQHISDISLKEIIDQISKTQINTLISNKLVCKSISDDPIFISLYDFAVIMTVNTLKIDTYKSSTNDLQRTLLLWNSLIFLFLSDVFGILISEMENNKIFKIVRDLVNLSKISDIKPLVFYRIALLTRRIIYSNPCVLNEMPQFEMNELCALFEIFKHSDLLNINQAISYRYHEKRNLTHNDIGFIHHIYTSNSNLLHSLDPVKITDNLIKGYIENKSTHILNTLIIVIPHLKDPFLSHLVSRIIRLRKPSFSSQGVYLKLLCCCFKLTPSLSEKIFEAIILILNHIPHFWLFYEDCRNVTHIIAQQTSYDHFFKILIEKYSVCKNLLRCHLQNLPYEDENWAELTDKQKNENICNLSSNIVLIPVSQTQIQPPGIDITSDVSLELLELKKISKQLIKKVNNSIISPKEATALKSILFDLKNLIKN